MPSDVQQLHSHFFDESLQAVDRMEAALLALEAREPDADGIHTMFRVAHSIKGGSSMLGFDEVTSFTHTLESILALVRAGMLPLTHAHTDLLLQGVDVLRELLAAARRGDPADVQRVADVQLDLERLAAGVRRAASGRPAEVSGARGAAAGASAAEAPAAAAPAERAGSVRVAVRRIDELLETLRAAGEVRARLQAVAGALGDRAPPRLASDVAQLGALMRELEARIAGLRRLPLSFLFDRLPRLVRDAERRLDKTIVLETRGREIELDKAAVEALGDPLMHLVRNAVDHGIERPGRRAAAGKPETGLVRVVARHEAGALLIEVADDGAGLDRQGIVDRARQMGLLTASECPADAGIDDLLFVPGLSTVTSATLLSGRGVGLDVVRRNVMALGGRIGVCSAPGRGTRFVLTLPLGGG